jgi:cytochrome c
MKKITSLFAFFLLLGPMDFAFADYDLLVKSNCTACHYVDKRKYGPKLNEVAAKYADDPNAAEKLAKKIKSGGSGVWGEDMMPPQAQLSAANSLILANYILSLKQP